MPARKYIFLILFLFLSSQLFAQGFFSRQDEEQEEEEAEQKSEEGSHEIGVSPLTHRQSREKLSAAFAAPSSKKRAAPHGTAPETVSSLPAKDG